MQNGDRDVGGPVNDATVHVNRGCSGVLVTKSLVLTAGHCVPDNARPRFPRRGFWNSLTRRVRIEFGPDRQNPTLSRWGVSYNPAGLIDVSLIRLDDPVPTNVALPARPLTMNPNGEAPERFLRGKSFVAAGWGVPGASRYRQTGGLRFNRMPYEVFDTLEPTRMKATGSVQLQGGDSGSPLYWISPGTGVRHVVGIAQGVESNGGRYYVVASSGGVEPRMKFRQPSLSAWLERELADDALPPDPLLPLFSWWDGTGMDNRATTSPDSGYTPGEYAPSGLVLGEALEHLVEGRMMGAHRLYRHEGYLFDPHKPKPAGTVPVFGWLHGGRSDHFLSSDPRYRIPLSQVSWRAGDRLLTARRQREGYALRRLEGFAYDPKRPRPAGTIPLFSWWNPSRLDNFASTDPRWSVDPETLRWSGEHLANQVAKDAYSCYRLEGYVFPPLRT